jgi:hypothetical protein
MRIFSQPTWVRESKLKIQDPDNWNLRSGIWDLERSSTYLLFQIGIGAVSAREPRNVNVAGVASLSVTYA